MSSFFSDFTGNLRAQKPSKSHTERANIMGRTVFSQGFGLAYTRINMSGVNSVLLCLSSIHYTYSKFAPTSLFPFTTATKRVHHHRQSMPPPQFRRSCERVILRLPRPLTRPSLPLRPSANHCASEDASVVAPAPLWYP